VEELKNCVHTVSLIRPKAYTSCATKNPCLGSRIINLVPAWIWIFRLRLKMTDKKMRFRMTHPGRHTEEEQWRTAGGEERWDVWTVG